MSRTAGTVVTGLPRIRVQHPWTKATLLDGKFVTYEISIRHRGSMFYRRPSSSVRRRFKEFVWLRKQIQYHNQDWIVPKHPPKTVFRSFDQNFIMKRCRALEDFMNELQKLPYCLADTAFHLFCQTDLNCEQMELMVDGLLPDEMMEKVWAAEGEQGDLFETSDGKALYKTALAKARKWYMPRD